MNRKNRRTAAALLAVLLSAALLGGCGSTGEGVPPASGVVTGAAAVGINTCTGCHTAQTADWLTSRHANAESGLDSSGSPTFGQIYTGGVFTNPVTAPVTCKNCHDPNGDSVNIVSAGNIGSVARPVVGCEACHGGGSLHNGSGPISLLSNTTGTTLGTVQVSGQFVMCTACHQLLDPTTGALNTSPTHSTGAPAPNGSLYVIMDTHFATALASYGSSTTPITGYAMDFSSDTVCTDCHNPHKNADINKEWALSAHAATAGNAAWADHNWSTSPSCQRCHTATGYAAYADALRSGNTTLANQIRTGTLSPPPILSTALWKPEMLKCRGCHTDNRGTLRNPGAYTADYSYNAQNPVVTFAYPNLAGSNVCILCHSGRQSGDTIKSLSSGVTFTNKSLISGHHFQSGAVMFKAGGYNYSGRDYSNLSIYQHDEIGTPSAPNTGSNGPCIGCHMSRPNGVGNHLFLPASKDENETTLVSSIVSEVCFQCHGPNDTAFLDMVNTQKDLFVDADLALQYLLEKQGYYVRNNSSYLLRDNTGTASINNGTTTVSGTGTLWNTVSTASGTAVQAGDYFRIDSDGTYYKISAVTDTSLTLDSTTPPYRPYYGANATNAPYTYDGTNATNMAYTVIQSSGITNWLTQTGTGYVPAATTDTDATGNTTGKNNMGAAANVYLLGNEPGAYVHNRYYAKRLIYDSIDWIDDNQMNYSVGQTLNDICTSTPQPWCASAKKYLLPNGKLGISAERP